MKAGDAWPATGGITSNDLVPSKHRIYPESRVGGFSRCDGTVEFYSRVNAILRPNMVIVDFGAGRGAWFDDHESSYRRGLRDLRGKAARVIGVDIDPVVRKNRAIDEAVVFTPQKSLPFAEGTVDLIVADWTLEHISDPVGIADELIRVLKPGGWICARTPNRWGYIALGATIVPNRWHVAALSRLQPHREAKDIFPTAYRLNTRRALIKAFSPRLFEHFVYGMNPEPAYFGDSLVAWRLSQSLSRLLPSAMFPVLHVFLWRRSPTCGT